MKAEEDAERKPVRLGGSGKWEGEVTQLIQSNAVRKWQRQTCHPKLSQKLLGGPPLHKTQNNIPRGPVHGFGVNLPGFKSYSYWVLTLGPSLGKLHNFPMASVSSSEKENDCNINPFPRAPMRIKDKLCEYLGKH